MPYRLKITKNKTREYAAIVEDIYDSTRKGSTSRTLITYGDLVKKRLINPNIDAEIQDKLEQLNADNDLSDKAWSDRHLKNIDVQKLANPCKKACIGMVFYRKFWERLNLHTLFDRIMRNSRGKISYDLDLAVFFLVAMRILNPASKKKSYELKDRHIFDFNSISLDNIYASLEDISIRKDTIINNLNDNLKEIYKRVDTIALYDVTTFYFESFDSDALRHRGMSKENKTNEVQVVLGLLIDSNGIPINYELFKGNTSETNTIIDVVNKYRQENGLSKVTIIADRGLNSFNNLKSLSDNKFDYIVAQSIDRLDAKLKAQVFDENWDKVQTDQDENDVFKVKVINTSTSNTLNNKVIVTWSASRHAHDVKVLNERYAKSQELIKKGQGAIDASFKHGTRQFIKKSKGSKVEYETNGALYEKRLKYAGYYCLTTSKIDRSPSEIYSELRQLWRIEECFRVMKTNLSARPIYVWTINKIRGHFLICYLALVIERLSYYKLKEANLDLSNHQVIETLANSELSVIDKAVVKKTLYMRLGVGMNNEENLNEITRVNQMLQVAGVPPLATVEDRISLSKKFGVRSNCLIV